MMSVWHYHGKLWKLYCEDWELAKSLRRRKDIINGGEYMKKGLNFGWDFIIPNRGLKDAIVRSSTSFDPSF